MKKIFLVILASKTTYATMAQKSFNIKFSEAGIVGLSLDEKIISSLQFENIDSYTRKGELSITSKKIALYYFPQLSFSLENAIINHCIIGLDSSLIIRYLFISFSAINFDLESLLLPYFRKAKYEVINDKMNLGSRRQLWFDYQNKFKIVLIKAIDLDDNKLASYELKFTSNSIQPDFLSPMLSVKQ